jgi:hypothetical protein
MKTITMINPKTSNSYEIPVPEMMDYMLQGLVPFDTADNNGCQEPEDISLDDEIYRVDVDASEAVDRDIETACFNEETVEEIVKESDHTKENVITALRDINKLNAAIAWLGDLQTEDEMLAGTASHLNGQGFSAAFARTGRRLWQWITGKDAKTMEERWEKKCLSHKRANAAFQRQTRNYEFSTAIELAQYVAAFHWRQLEHIIAADFEGMDLTKVDLKKTVKNSKPIDWTDITGARVIQVKGGGTQLLWDSRRIWLPTSQLKMQNGAYRIPTWLAQKNDMV